MRSNNSNINPLNPELKPICYLLALLGAHHFLHVSRMRVKFLTFRLLMSYIYMEHLFLMFPDHTQRRSTVGRTPLDEWSARRRDISRLRVNNNNNYYYYLILVNMYLLQVIFKRQWVTCTLASLHQWGWNDCTFFIRLNGVFCIFKCVMILNCTS